MNPGKMNQRIEIWSVTRSRGAQGGWEETWALYKTRWASVQLTKAQEKFKGGQIQNPVDALFRIRYVSGITEEMRIRHDGNHYEILSVINPEEANRELEIAGKKIIADEADF